MARNYFADDRGMALAIAVLFLFVLSLLTAALYGTALSEIGASSRYEKGEQAFYAAEAGVKHALSWLGQQSTAPENATGMPPWFADKVDETAATPPLREATPFGGYWFRYRVEHMKDDYLPPNGEESAKIGTASSTAPVVHYYRITAEGADTAAATGGVRKKVQVVTTVRY